MRSRRISLYGVPASLSDLLSSAGVRYRLGMTQRHRMCPLGVACPLRRASLGGRLAGIVPGAAKVEEPSESSATKILGVKCGCEADPARPDRPNPSLTSQAYVRKESTFVTSMITKRCSGFSPGSRWPWASALAGACRPRRPPRSGTRSPAARAAATGRSTPATATTAACSSPRGTWKAFGGKKYGSQPTRPARPSRSPSPDGCSPDRVAGPGRPAAGGPD